MLPISNVLVSRSIGWWCIPDRGHAADDGLPKVTGIDDAHGLGLVDGGVFEDNAEDEVETRQTAPAPDMPTASDNALHDFTCTPYRAWHDHCDVAFGDIANSAFEKLMLPRGNFQESYFFEMEKLLFQLFGSRKVTFLAFSNFTVSLKSNVFNLF